MTNIEDCQNILKKNISQDIGPVPAACNSSHAKPSERVDEIPVNHVDGVDVESDTL